MDSISRAEFASRVEAAAAVGHTHVCLHVEGCHPATVPLPDAVFMTGLYYMRSGFPTYENWNRRCFDPRVTGVTETQVGSNRSFGRVFARFSNE